jgi:hypothetical protein
VRLCARYLLLLRPTPEHIAWLAEKTPLLGSPTIEEVSEDSQTYLLPVFDDRAYAEAWVLKKWRFFLEQQLLEWVPNKRRWPKRMDRVLFAKWFTLEIHEMVWDLNDLNDLNEKADLYE